jgi:methanogenic corrinoid protein MtbC1
MQRHLAEGLAAAEAAGLARTREEPVTQPSTAVSAVRDELDVALATLDESRAHAALDSLLAQVSLDSALGDVVVPYLHELGERWERGEVSIAQEHFASSLLRGRLLGLARGWGRGFGPAAVLACAPGERHDLGLIAFGLALRARGWRIVYLGADTPLESVADAARVARPAYVVVSAVDPKTFRVQREALTRLAREHRLCLGGVGAAKAKLDSDVVTLDGGPVEEAERLTNLAQSARLRG